MAELADATDLKSVDLIDREGSIPSIPNPGGTPARTKYPPGGGSEQDNNGDQSIGDPPARRPLSSPCLC